MLGSKAVIFTHLPVAIDGQPSVYTRRMTINLINRVLPYFKAYLQCENIGLVYVYVDTGVRLTLKHLKEEAETIQFTIAELEFEQNTRNCLKLAVDKAIRELAKNSGAAFNPSLASRFQFIGLPHLLTLIHSLYRIDRDLIQDLAGRGGRFTYDSPKFVEAIIRLVRGAHQPHALFPVLRIDEDVKVNEAAIGLLLDEAREAMQSNQTNCWFFSGGYGTLGGPPEPVNDYAVRLAWLVDRENPDTLSSQAGCFLRDLGEFGATQVSTGAPLSGFLTDWLEKERKGHTANRASQQVISGAGLFMSRWAIDTLPPFMNFPTLITWIDDHLKRRLHEVLGHLSHPPDDKEHINDALFKQDRHPDGIKDKDIDWARDVYFERLLSGCIMHALITTPDGQKGELAVEVAAVLDRHLLTFDKDPLRRRLTDVALKTAIAVLDVWRHADYGNAVLSHWAESKYQGIAGDPPIDSGPAIKIDQAKQLIGDIVEDAISYVHLVTRWRQYKDAIGHLGPVHAYWLFRNVEGNV